MKRLGITFALVLSMGLGGISLSACSARTTGTARVTVAPRLVYVGPGLWVVSDWHSPVFFYDSYYWMVTDGIWYRSLYYDTAFVRVVYTAVPRPVVSIRRPRRYIRYRAPARARVRALHRPKKAAPRHKATPRRSPAKPPPRRRDYRDKKRGGR